MSDLFGMSLEAKIELGKKFKHARDFLGLSAEEAAKVCGVKLSEVKHLEEFAILKPEPIIVPIRCCEATWAYNLGVIAPHKFAFRFVITQDLENGRQNDELGGPGSYSTNMFFLPAAFGKWQIIEHLRTHSHTSFEAALAGCKNGIEGLGKIKFEKKTPDARNPV